MTTNDNNNKNNTLPEYIQGIPTAKNKSRERIDLIKKYYSNLWKKLQREGRSNKIFNNYLGVDVYIVEKESDKKTINTASKNWQSTYAVKHLEDVVKNARCEENTTVFFAPKKGTQSKFHYKNIAILYYDFVDPNISYLNLKARLTIGIKASEKHVQYCVNKIDIKEKSQPYKALTNE